MPLSSPTLRTAPPAPSHPFRERAPRPDLDNIFRFSGADRAGEPAAADQAQTPRAAQPDLDAALDMLNRAAKAMDAMQARYQRVEDDARNVAARADRTLAAAQTQARDWEARALASEAERDQLKTRALQAEERADVAERRAAAAREWLGTFYDKVMAAFELQPFSDPAAL